MGQAWDLNLHIWFNFYLFFLVPSSEETSFWPPCMVYISSHHYTLTGLALCYLNSYKKFSSLNDWYTILDGIQSTVVEGASYQANTPPPSHLGRIDLVLREDKVFLGGTKTHYKTCVPLLIFLDLIVPTNGWIWPILSRASEWIPSSMRKSATWPTSQTRPSTSQASSTKPSLRYHILGEL